jgi:transglutaminase-like putative cysteine protease
MPSLTIRHVTTYRYRQPVAFGEHRMMLRPRDSHDQRVIEASLEISPEPRSLRFVQDAYGNHVGIAQFSGRSKELYFESTVCLEHSPLDAADLDFEDAVRTFPVDYSADEMPDLAYCIERHQPDPANEVGRWANQFLGAARSLGLAARFASGYLAVPLDDPEEPTSGSARGATHAWAQIYLPGTGWIDFDPTSGSVGKIGLVTVAVVRDPLHATPLHGTFFGFPSDHLGLEVQVSVMSGTPEAIWTTPQRSMWPQFRQSV